MPNLNNPLQNPLAKVFDFKTIFNDDIFYEGYEVVCNDPKFVTTDVKRGGVIRMGPTSNTGVYYLRFYMPSAADIPAADFETYKGKLIMTYAMKPWLYNGVATSGFDPNNYDGYADFTSQSQLSSTKTESTGRSFLDRWKEWVTKTGIASTANAGSLPSANRSITFTVIGTTTKNRKEMKTFSIDFTHIKP